ncbi:MAG: hypothetical protein IKS48_11305 [Eubacterium sp.]|nr:hypothetical protein [Eubacterium sp.]
MSVLYCEIIRMIIYIIQNNRVVRKNRLPRIFSWLKPSITTVIVTINKEAINDSKIRVTLDIVVNSGPRKFSDNNSRK